MRDVTLPRNEQEGSDESRLALGVLQGRLCSLPGSGSEGQEGRKYALRLLNGPPPERKPRPGRRSRSPRYSAELISILAAVWAAAGYPWSVVLKALLPRWMPWVRKRYGLKPEMEEQLLRISARQIDRRLRERKARPKHRRYGGTKPGPLLKHQIPIKTDNWSVQMPGFTEIDLVAHGGNSAEANSPIRSM